MENLNKVIHHISKFTNNSECEFELKHKGELIFTGTENQCYIKLQRVQSQSADWAMKYEGYTITPKKDGN